MLLGACYFRRDRGLTLIELMITVAIVGILGALALPSFNDAIDKYRLKAGAEALYGDLQYARTVAIRSNTTVYFSADATCWGMNSGSACTCSTANSCLLKQVNISAFPGLAVSSSAAATSIDGIRGLAGGGPITVTLTSKRGKQAQLSLSILGRAALCSPNTSATVYVVDYPAC